MLLTHPLFPHEWNMERSCITLMQLKQKTNVLFIWVHIISTLLVSTHKESHHSVPNGSGNDKLLSPTLQESFMCYYSFIHSHYLSIYYIASLLLRRRHSLSTSILSVSDELHQCGMMSLPFVRLNLFAPFVEFQGWVAFYVGTFTNGFHHGAVNCCDVNRQIVFEILGDLVPGGRKSFAMSAPCPNSSRTSQ